MGNNEINEMVSVIQKYDDDLTGGNSLYNRYFFPNIPDKVVTKLLKNFDSNLPAASSLVAYYDTTLLNSGKAGFVFTNDGLYHKSSGKTVYYRYSDIKKMYIEYDNLVIVTSNEDYLDNTINDVFDMRTLKYILEDIKAIDRIYGQTSEKETGQIDKKSNKIDLPESFRKKCEKVIHGASVACGGVGAAGAQIPVADNAVIVPIQISMIVALGKIFDLSISESAAKSIIASAGASITGRTISQLFIGWIPGVGNAINSATAAGITEIIGWLAVKNFYQRYQEDLNKGRFEGMKAGYAEASDEYEIKFRKQAEDFINQKKDIRAEFELYTKLILDYENYIFILEKHNTSPENMEIIEKEYEELKELSEYSSSDNIVETIKDDAYESADIDEKIDRFIRGEIDVVKNAEKYNDLLTELKEYINELIENHRPNGMILEYYEKYTRLILLNNQSEILSGDLQEKSDTSIFGGISYYEEMRKKAINYIDGIVDFKSEMNEYKKLLKDYEEYLIILVSTEEYDSVLEYMNLYVRLKNLYKH